MRGTRLVVAMLGLTFGCSGSPYRCAADAQCVLGGEQGICEPAGFCSFPDPACESGNRFEPNAGDDLGGTCAPPACGVTGNACCETGEACRAGGTCVAGTCESCLAEVAFGRRFACMRKPSGAVFCSGENDSGQLGIGLGSQPQADAEQVRDNTTAFIDDATAIAAGRQHACALRAGGAVWCWGAGFNDVAIPVNGADGNPLTGMTAIAASASFTCALDGSQQLLCWGDNAAGQLGDGTITSRATAAPVLVALGGAPLAGVTSFTLGGDHACATNAANEVWCWGRNDHAQLGNGTTGNQASPVRALVDSSSVAAGRFHTCAVVADGTIACWGGGGHNRLGRGTFDGSDAVMPIQVVAEPGEMTPFGNAVAVAAGAVSCAITADTHVWCWGDNRYGQTGTGATSVVPVEVVDTDGKPLTGAERLMVGYSHACARLAGGQIRCWGRNSEGAFGDGTFLNRGLATEMTATCP